ncbi:MAG: hypothetical protein GY874_23795, partial [Desulfobacteraceae bacterium]|nr:hypothetical protein [Desulfobacteraceae bacterium]
ENTDTENTDTENTDTENTDTENTDTENTDTENTDTENTDTTDGGDTAGMTDMAYEVFTLVNQERAKVNLTELSADSILTEVAQDRTQRLEIETPIDDDGNVEYFDHLPDTWGDIQSAGYEGNGYGENIAWGSGQGSENATPEGVMNGWMNSQGHKKNILGDFTDLGVGFIEADSGFWWTQVFGSK